MALQDAGGLYTNPVLENIEVTDGSLTFGLEMIEKADWIGITNIKLSYIGLLGIDKLKVSLEEARLCRLPLMSQWLIGRLVRP